MRKSVSILGAGRVGQSIARLLSMKGYRIEHLVCRSMEHAQKAALFVGAGSASTAILDVLSSELVFITTPDDQIEAMVAVLADSGRLRSSHTLIHCSGALGIDSLHAAGACGAKVMSIHPMQAVASAESGVALLSGSYFGIEAQTEDLAQARSLVKDLGGTPVELHPGMKSLYHAGAVFASNYVVVLLGMATDILEAAGVHREAAVQGLVALAAGAVRNVKDTGLPHALTGPIERGDFNTVSKHLAALMDNPEFMSVYKALGEYAARMAMEKRPQKKARIDTLVSLLSAVGVRKG